MQYAYDRFDNLAALGREVEDGNRKAAEKFNISRGVWLPIITSSCVTKAATFRKDSRGIMLPLIVVEPVILPASERPDNTLSSVVLPAPDEPITASNWPGDAWRLMPLMAASVRL